MHFLFNLKSKNVHQFLVNFITVQYVVLEEIAEREDKVAFKNIDNKNF